MIGHDWMIRKKFETIRNASIDELEKMCLVDPDAITLECFTRITLEILTAEEAQTAKDSQDAVNNIDKLYKILGKISYNTMQSILSSGGENGKQST